MKLINYSLLLFISIFIFLSFVIEPVRFEETDQTNFSNDLPGELGNTQRFLQDLLEESEATAENVDEIQKDQDSEQEL